MAFAGLIPHAVLGLLAGVAADRWNRKRLMIAADGVRALAIATLATLIVLDRVEFWQIAVVALVEGTGAVFFTAAHAGALRAIVPAPQLPAAVGAMIRARAAAVTLAGPPLGGVLFAVGRAVPFLFDAVSYAFSFLTLVLMRTPFQQEREVDSARLRAQIVEGFRFLWTRPFLRTCAFLYGLGNFTLPAVLLVIIVAGQRQGLSSAAIGALLAGFLLSTVSVRATVAVFLACSFALALWGTLSPSIRRAPSLDELGALTR